MHWIRRRIAMVSLLALLVSGLSVLAASHVASAHERYSDRSGSGFNDQYVFATTRDVNQMDAPAGLKLTLFPVTIVLDTVLLPFAVIAGFVT